MNSRCILPVAAALSLAFALTQAEAAGSRRLVQSGEAFLEGEFDGVALDPAGQLMVAPVRATDWTTPDFYVWDLALDAKGRVVAGSGDGGTIYREGDDGLETWTETLALEILCLLPWQGGMLAGSSPDGVVFGIDAEGRHEVALDIPQQSIWDLAPGSTPGSWLAAAGPVARIVRVSEDAPAGEELYSFSATNATRLIRSGSTLWIGTQGPGLVYRVDGDDGDEARLVFEAAEDEVRDIESDGAGGVFVLSIHSGETTEESEAAASRVTWLPADGGRETVFSGDERFLSLARHADGALLLGEAGAGRLVRLTMEGQRSLWAEIDGGDPLTLLVTEEGTTYVGTGNLGAVVRLHQDEGEGGTYTSGVLEAEHLERWGRLQADGAVEGVEFSTRTGVRRVPDDSWSEWSSPRAVGEPIASPAAPFLQYRLAIEPKADATVTAVRIAYAERNLPPKLATVRVEAAGGTMALGGTNSSPAPVSQRFDDGLGIEYTVYQSRAKAEPDQSAWARGLRTVRWTATDPNEDPLRYHVEVKSQGGDDWLRVATDLEQTVYAWDTRSFSDGVYHVRITAHDGAGNSVARQRNTVATSAPVHVDNSPPRVRRLQWSGADAEQIEAEVEDESSTIAEVAVRADEGSWIVVEPEDGVLDGPTERFLFARPEAPRAGGIDRIWLRVVDAAGNVNLQELAARR